MDPRLARAIVDKWVQLAEKCYPEKYGERLQLEVSTKPSLTSAIEARFNAILTPQRNLSELEHAQDAEFTAITDQRSTECASVSSEPARDETQAKALARIFDE